MTNSTLNVSLFVDNILEGNEAFLLTIDQTSLQTVIISDNSTIVMIIDDDRKYSLSLTH